MLADWDSLDDHGLENPGRDAVLQARGVAGLTNCGRRLRICPSASSRCEAGLRAEAIDPAALLPGVEVAGVATFLEAVGTGQIVSC